VALWILGTCLGTMLRLAILLSVHFLALVLSSPTAKRIVYDPPITYPTLGTVWNVGDIRTVTWYSIPLPCTVERSHFVPCRDISQLPPGTGPGMVLLGYLSSGSENLMIGTLIEKSSRSTLTIHIPLDNPLATGFSLADASVQITVPSVPERDDYIVVCKLFISLSPEIITELDPG
jgi:hypothetical protein